MLEAKASIIGLAIVAALIAIATGSILPRRSYGAPPSTGSKASVSRKRSETPTSRMWPTISEFYVTKDSFVVEGRGLASVEVLSAPSGTGITREEYQHVGSMAKKSGQSAKQIWTMPRICPGIATNVLAIGFNTSGHEVGELFLPYDGVTDVANALCPHGVAEHGLVGANGDFELSYPDSFVVCRRSPRQHDSWIPERYCGAYIPVCRDTEDHSSDAVAECLSYLDGELKGTTFQQAVLALSIKDRSEADCMRIGPSEEINGREFAKGRESQSAAMGHVQDSIEYRTFGGGKCYEFSLNINYLDGIGFDPKTVKLPSADQLKALFWRLKRVMRTLKINPWPSIIPSPSK